METILRLGQHNPVRYRRKDVAYLIDFIKSNKIEVLILNQGSITMFAQIIKGLFPKIKIICWLHNNYDTYMNHYFKYANKQLITSLQISDGIICLTKKDQEMFSKFNDNTLCIYNPLTIEPSGISKLNEKVISFTSRISFQHKGIDILVEVAKNSRGMDHKSCWTRFRGRNRKISETNNTK